MRYVAALLLIGSLLLASGEAAGERAASSLPFLLVALPSLGTVSWRCDTKNANRFSLEFHQFPPTADTYIRLIAGGRTVKSVHSLPSETVGFPFLTTRYQRLTFVQGTEPRTLYAHVTVDFKLQPGYSFCWPYVPPRTTAAFWTRSNA